MDTAARLHVVEARETGWWSEIHECQQQDVRFANHRSRTLMYDRIELVINDC